MLFILLKYVHVISAIVAVGANVTYGIWIVRASRWPENLPFTLQGIKFIDDKIANPAYVMLLITGLAMMHFAQIPLSTSWLLVSMALYVLVVLLGLLGYTRTLRRQIEVLVAQGAGSPAYRAIARRGHRFGASIGVLVLAIVFLMVVKPALW